MCPFTSNKIFLVVGDPFAATTHSDLFLRATKMGVKCKVFHNASILNAVGSTGLFLYHFGPTVSIPLWSEEEGWRPTSFYDKLAINRKNNFHTICLLDIKVKEVSMANLLKGRNNVYEPPRYMTICEAIQQLLAVEKEKGEGIISIDTLAVACCRMGSEGQLIKSGTLGELLAWNGDGEGFGGPLHTLVIPGEELHEIEKEMLDLWKI